MTKFKNIEAVCAKLGITIEDLPTSAHDKIELIVKAYNGDWKPDWSNSEPKYYPWFNMEDFSLDCVDYAYGCSDVSSRLCFKNRKDAEEAVKVFKDLYKEYMLG